MAGVTRATLRRQRRKEEREREHDERHRAAALERRREEEREQQREEERRQETLQQAQEFAAALDAAHEQARERREALLARIRAQKRAERRDMARQDQQRDVLLNALRAVNRNERLLAAQAEARRAAARQAHLNEQREGTREETRQARLVEQREAARLQAHDARLAEQRQLQRDSEQAEARRDAVRQARLEEQRKAGQTEAQHEAARQARLAEQRVANQIEAQREAARQAHLAEQHEADQSEAQREAARLQVHQAARDERLAEQREANQAEARHEAARQVRLTEQREADREERLQAERAARRADDLRAAQQQQWRASARADTRDPLRDHIPSGRLSGALPWLAVDGNHIVNLRDDPIILRGINLLGLDSAAPDPELGFAVGANLTPATIDAVLDWGTNVIRVAINRSRVLQGHRRWSAWDYLADLDAIIQRAAQGGAYTLLSLRRLDDFTMFGTLPGAGGKQVPNFIAPQPDYDTIGMWQLLGERYADEPAVLFDLCAAPRPALDDDLTGMYINWELWKLWIRLVVAELRQVHPRAVCFVSGLIGDPNGGTDLSEFPVLGMKNQPIPNLIYTAQLYARNINARWDMQALARHGLARAHPLFVTEWGGQWTDLAWGEQTALALRAAGLGWTAAHWNDEPALAQFVGQQFVPTAFGKVVRRALAWVDEPISTQ